MSGYYGSSYDKLCCCCIRCCNYCDNNKQDSNDIHDDEEKNQFDDNGRVKPHQLESTMNTSHEIEITQQTQTVTMTISNLSV